MSTSRRIITLVLAIAGLAVGVPSAFADSPSTLTVESYGFGQARSCTTEYERIALPQYGAWGWYVDGCTVKVKCQFREGCAVGGHSTIQNELRRGGRVTLTSRLRILDSRGRIEQRRFDRSCDSREYCTAGHINVGLRRGAMASVQCNGVQEPAQNQARVKCLVFIQRGYRRACPDADTPVDEMADDDAEAAVLCLTNLERTRAGLPGLAYSRDLHVAARGHAEHASRSRWWDSRVPEEESSKPDHPNNPHRTPEYHPLEGALPPTRAAAAGYCHRSPGWNEWLVKENAYTKGAAVTPRDAVNSWMSRDSDRATILDPALFELGVGVTLMNADQSVDNDLGAAFIQDLGACVA
jgi:uncharacterized protein YkwD